MDMQLKKSLKEYDDSVAVVLGAYVNALHIIRNLGSQGIPVICISGNNAAIGMHSQYVEQAVAIDYSKDMSILYKGLLTIGQQLRTKAVIFPTRDEHVKILSDNYEALSRYYYIGVNPDNKDNIVSKEYQYKVCAEIGVPFPKSYYLKSKEDLDALAEDSLEMMYPILIKPLSRTDATYKMFRAIEIGSSNELKEAMPILAKHIDVGYVASEIIPGEPDQLWTYGCYCDSNSNIIAGFTGKKLTQRPYYFGVFSTARYVRNDTVSEQGKRLLEAVKHVGLSQVEFKYDYRDNKYKLMEINPRYWMWHGVGIKDDLSLALVHYYHIKGDIESFEKLNKEQSEKVAHIVFFFSELANIITNKPRIKFIKNFFKAIALPNKIEAIFDSKDIKPLLYFIINVLKLKLGKNNIAEETN